MKEYLGKEVKVKIDRPLGSKHPEYGFYYPINYGYIPNTIADDGEEIIHRITIENFFDINGIKAHDICKVYEMRMKQEFYEIEEYEVTADIIPSIAKWVKADEFKARRKTFYPVELIEYL